MRPEYSFEFETPGLDVREDHFFFILRVPQAKTVMYLV
jgi:hypothetical protein